MRKARQRGQSLVLFALMLMLLALMVLVTISIGARVSERLELQTMADAAAYSNAVATARSFNSISLLNRTQISHMAVAAGLESVINFSSLYYAHIETALNVFVGFEKCTISMCSVTCVPAGPHGCQIEVAASVQAGAQALATELCRVKGGFNGLDEAAAGDVRHAVQQAFDLYPMEQDIYGRLQSEVLQKQKLAGRVAVSSGAAEVTAPPVDAITLRELQGMKGCVGAGAACDEPYHMSHVYYAAMGTRGSAFITDRAGAQGMINGRLKDRPWTPASNAVAVGTLTSAMAPAMGARGSAYFNSDVPSHGTAADGLAVTADDHGLQSASYSYFVPEDRRPGFCCEGYGTPPPVPPGLDGCPKGKRGVRPYINYAKGRVVPTWSNLVSVEAGVAGNLHQWSTGGDSNAGAHSTPACVGNCPTVWPMFIDYNSDLVANTADVFGQPKNYALLQRDYSARPPDPWNLFFHFRFTPGSKTVFDNRGLALASGADISKQHALATGLAYYHRMGHWKEPPNFLNPFWRATLTAWDIDRQGQGADVPDLLTAAGAPDSALSIELLTAAGYRGAH